MVSIKMEGVDELITYINNLPTKMEKQLDKGNLQFMKDIKKSAKLRAPKDTRELVDSITLSQTVSKGKQKQWKLEVGAPHGIFQEFGFRPHAAPILNSKKLPTPGIYFVSKWKPFMQPAVTHNLLKLNQGLDNSISRAIK